MAKLIRNRRIVEDSWQRLPPDAAAFPAVGNWIVPLACWMAGREGLLAPSRSGRLGLRIEGHDELGPIAAELERFALVEVHCAKFADGRIYSTGRLLRERYGYRGELRACGDLLRDHLLMLERCGFDSFVLRHSEDLEASLSAFGEFSEQYQTCAAQPLPLFRRHLRTAA